MSQPFWRQVSESLDTLSQNEGAILVRDVNGWSALERPGPNHRLIVNDDGEIEWTPGTSGGGVASPWIYDDPLDPWFLEANGVGYLRYRSLSDKLFMFQCRVRSSGNNETDPIYIMPEEYRPSRSFVTTGYNGGNVGMFRLLTSGVIYRWQVSGAHPIFSLVWSID